MVVHSAVQRKAIWRRLNTVARLLPTLLVILIIGGCALYGEGEPADSKYHLVQGQSAHFEKVLEFYIASSPEAYSVLPAEQVEKLFAEPKWSAPPGVELNATSVRKVESASLSWKSDRFERKATGYRLLLTCDCAVLPDAPVGNVAIAVTFPRLRADLGRDQQGNPLHVRFVPGIRGGQSGNDNKVEIVPLKIYSSTWARTWNLYNSWLIVLAIVLGACLLGRAIARQRG